MRKGILLFNILVVLLLFISIFIKNYLLSILFLLFYIIFNIIIYIKGYIKEKNKKYEEPSKIVYKMPLLEDFKNEINSKLDQLIYNIDFGYTNSKKLIENLHSNTYSISDIKKIIFEIIDETINLFYLKERDSKLGKIKNFFCPLCFSTEIFLEFGNYLQDTIRNNASNVINTLDKIKKEQDSSYNILLDILNDFIKKVEKGKLSQLKNKENLDSFFSRVQKSQSDISFTINNYFNEFKNIDIISQEIEDISEKIRMITFNLSIEASKSENRAFRVISKELQNLSLKTQNFVKNIISNTKKSIKNIESEREKRIKDLNELEDVIQNARILNQEFEDLMKGIYTIAEKLNTTVNIFIEDKKNIFSIFNNIQTVQIDSEIIEHFLKFIGDIFNSKIDFLHESIGGKLGACDDIPYKKEIIKNTFKKVEEYVTTKQEKEILKILYKKYLNLEIEEASYKEDDVIIF